MQELWEGVGAVLWVLVLVLVLLLLLLREPVGVPCAPRNAADSLLPLQTTAALIISPALEPSLNPPPDSPVQP